MLNKTFRSAVSAFLLMMTMALTSSGISFFVAPVCDDLGIGRGSFSIYFSIMTASSAMSVYLFGPYINRKGVRGVMLLLSFWGCIGFWLFSYAKQLWMFYLIAIYFGVFASNFLTMLSNVIVQQTSGTVDVSSLLGIVMAGSGVGGVIVSQVLPQMIDLYGWQWGYRFLGLAWFVLTFLAYLILGNCYNINYQNSSDDSLAEGMTRAEAVRSSKLYLLIICTLILSICCGIQQHVPSILGAMKFETSQISIIMTVMTASLAAGKALQGILYGKIGVIKGSYFIFILFSISFLLMLHRAFVYPAVITMAVGMGALTTLIPMIARYIFGTREYPSIWSIFVTVNCIGVLFASPVWGMVYDIFGTYAPALIAAAVILILGLAAFPFIFSKKTA